MSVIFIRRVVLDMLQSGGNKTVNKLENICDIIILKVAESKSIILNGTTNLHIFTNVTMNAQTYRDEILDSYMKLFRVAIDNIFRIKYNA